MLVERIDPLVIFVVLSIVCALSIEASARELNEAWGGAVLTTCYSESEHVYLMDQSVKHEVNLREKAVAEKFPCYFYVKSGQASVSAPDISMQLFAFVAFFSLTVGIPLIGMLVHHEIADRGFTHWLRHRSDVAINITKNVRRRQQFSILEILLCIRFIVATEAYVRCCWSFMLVKTVICSFPPDIAWFAIGAPLTRIIGTVFFPFSFILIYVLIVHFSMPIPFDRSVATLALFPLTSYHSWGPWKALCIALKEHQAAQFTPKLLPLASSLSTEGPCIVFGPVVRSLLLRVRC